MGTEDSLVTSETQAAAQQSPTAPCLNPRKLLLSTRHITAKGDEIRIPRYLSGYGDVFAAIGSARKALVAFRDGSHSMFTDRLGAGERDLHPLVKAAMVDLTLAFFKELLGSANGLLATHSSRYDGLLARFESVPQAAP